MWLSFNEYVVVKLMAFILIQYLRKNRETYYRRNNRWFITTPWIFLLRDWIQLNVSDRDIKCIWIYNKNNSSPRLSLYTHDLITLSEENMIMLSSNNLKLILSHQCFKNNYHFSLYYYFSWIHLLINLIKTFSDKN